MNNRGFKKGRLRRLSHIVISQPLYFVTTCTHGRRSILASDTASNILVEEWKGCTRRHNWSIGSYVIMPDHVHFFCRAICDQVALPQLLQAWKQWTSKKLVRQLGVAAPVWEEGFFDHVLRSAESYSEKWNYVFYNPVRAGLVNRPEEWKYYGHVHFE